MVALSRKISNLIVESLECQDVPISDDTRDPLRLTRAILKASPEDENGLFRRAQVLKGATTWLIRAGNEKNVESYGGSGPVDEAAQALVNMLIDMCQSFPLEAIGQLIHMSVEIVRHQQLPHNQLFSLLARFLVIASNSSRIRMAGSDEDIAGAEYLAVMLDRLLLAPWHPRSVLPLAMMLGDLAMNPKQQEAAVTKVMKQFEHIDSSDLPVLIYHLLLMSSKGQSKLILKGIVEFFDLLNGNLYCGHIMGSARPRSALRLGFAELATMQGTVILHLSFAIKQDQALGNEFLKYMKSGKLSYISPFSIACLLAMARVHRFEDNVMDFLKSSVLNIFKDAERTEREPWVKAAMMMQVIKMIPFGMEHLTQSLVQLAVYIMDTLAPSSWGMSGESTAPKKTTQPSTPNELACELSALILLQLFKEQEAVRTEILDHIMSRVVTKSASASCFLRLLELVVADCSSILLDHLQRVKEPLNYLSFLSPPIAIRLLGAVKDLALLNRPFRDGLIVILRKALFSKSLESRQVALSGMLMLLEPAPVKPRSFRAGPSRPIDPRADQIALSFSMEILTMLRRCLGQQLEIRLSLYDGLLRVSQQSPHLNPIIFEMLHAHFTRYYDRSGTRPSPIFLDECVANARNGMVPSLTEPLQYLMSSVIRTHLSLENPKRRSMQNDLPVNDQLQVECKRDLERLLLGLERAGLEDFELDKTSEFNMGTNLGIRNNMFASLVIGCLESAIEYVVLGRHGFATGGTTAASGSHMNGKGLAHARTPENEGYHGGSGADHLHAGAAEQIIQLFTKMRKLHDIVRERSVLTRGKRLGLLGEATVLGLKAVTYLMESVFAPPEDDPNLLDPEAQMLRQQDDFVYYISVAASSLLQKMQSSTAPLHDNEHDFCRRLCKVFVREFLVSERPNAPLSLAAAAKSKDKTKSLLMIGIEGLTAGLALLRHHYPVSSSPPSSTSPSSKTSTAPLYVANNTRSSPAWAANHDKIVAGFLAALLPQEHQMLSSAERAQIVAWTTSSVMLLDLEGLAACFIDYLETMVMTMINCTVSLVREAAGVLGLIQELARYLSRPPSGFSMVAPASTPLEEEQEDGEDGTLRRNSIYSHSHSQRLSSSGSKTVDRLSCTESATGVRVEGTELSLLVYWLVTLCRDQPVEDSPLTKAILTLLLALEQESAAKEIEQALYQKNGRRRQQQQHQQLTNASLPGGAQPVSVTSLLTTCPRAAVRLRLAGDVLLALDMNHGPGFEAVNDPRHQHEFGDDIDALQRIQSLYRELGADPQQPQDVPVAVSLSLVSVRNAATVADTLLVFVEQALDGLEWVLGKVKYCGLGAEMDQVYGHSGSNECGETTTNYPSVSSSSLSVDIFDGVQRVAEHKSASVSRQTPSSHSIATSDLYKVHTTTTNHAGPPPPPPPKKGVSELETEVCWRVEVCLWVLARLCLASLSSSVAERTIKVLQKTYRVLTALTKHFASKASSLSSSTSSAGNMSHRLFQAPGYHYSAGIGISAQAAGSGSSSSSVAFTGSFSSSSSSRQRGGSGAIQLPYEFLRVTQVAGLELSRHLYTFLTYFHALDQDVQERAHQQHARQNRDKNKGKGKKGKKEGMEDDLDDNGGEGSSNAAQGGVAAAAAPASQRGESGGGVGGAKPSKHRAKILRESKLIPGLIYVVEQYERYVIQLSNKSRVGLMQFMRRSTARDFRIQIQRLGDLGLQDRYEEEMQMREEQQQQQQQLQEQPPSPHDEMAMEVDDADEETLRMSKRMRLEP
ncbi:hypothetical protein BGZ73_005945 [Actinomortierella ambigua]|nr:hypothetical protein BGZ73_005945 [Actinomortierella ambigua]